MPIIIAVAILVVLLAAGGGYLYLRARRRKARLLADMSPERREMLDAEREHELAVAAAEKELRQAERTYEAAVDQAGHALADATKAHELRVHAAEKRLAQAQKLRASSAGLGSYGNQGLSVTVHEYSIKTNDGEAIFADGPVVASVDTAANLALLRAEAWARSDGPHRAESYDTGQVCLMVEAPGFVSVVPVKAGDEAHARHLAADIGPAARAAGDLIAERDHEIAAAQVELDQARTDRTNVKSAEHALTTTRADRSAVAEAHRALANVQADTKRIEAARAKLGLPAPKTENGGGSGASEAGDAQEADERKAGGEPDGESGA